MLTLVGAAVRVGHVGHAVGAVVALAAVLTHPVAVFIHLANTVIAVVVYVGAVADHGPAAELAHSMVVPAPQPVAAIVPVVAGQTLFVILIVG
jgi:pimeloyl-ACP methyl ester carboxylesterase